MRYELVGLALLMAAVTYPSRALPLLLPGAERLMRRLQPVLRYVGPAALAALAATATLTEPAENGAELRLGVEAVAVALAVLAARRGWLLLGIVLAAAVVAISRQLL